MLHRALKCLKTAKLMPKSKPVVLKTPNERASTCTFFILVQKRQTILPLSVVMQVNITTMNIGVVKEIIDPNLVPLKHGSSYSVQIDSLNHVEPRLVVFFNIFNLHVYVTIVKQHSKISFFILTSI